MTLGNVRKEFHKYGTEHPCQAVDEAAALAYLHHAQPEGQHAGQAQRKFKTRLGRGKCGVHHRGEHLVVAKKHQFDQCYKKSDDEKRHPNVVQYHTKQRNLASYTMQNYVFYTNDTK